MVHKCNNCKPHDFQDKLYGVNMRVMNRCQKDNKYIGHRCTVCGTLYKDLDFNADRKVFIK